MLTQTIFLTTLLKDVHKAFLEPPWKTFWTEVSYHKYSNRPIKSQQKCTRKITCFITTPHSDNTEPGTGVSGCLQTPRLSVRQYGICLFCNKNLRVPMHGYSCGAM